MHWNFVSTPALPASVSERASCNYPFCDRNDHPPGPDIGIRWDHLQSLSDVDDLAGCHQIFTALWRAVDPVPEAVPVADDENASVLYSARNVDFGIVGRAQVRCGPGLPHRDGSFYRGYRRRKDREAVEHEDRILSPGNSK